MPRASYYYYEPSLALAALFCGLFGLTFVYATFMTIRKRSWVWTVQLLAVLMEVVGYGARIGSTREPSDRNLYIIQFCLVILAPVLMAARWITPIFVSFDIVALIIQLIGAIIVSGTQPTDENAQDKMNLGKNIALAGLAIQIGAFGLFSVSAVRFHFTSRRFVAGLQARLGKTSGGKTVTVNGSSRRINPNWRHLLYAVMVSCLLILVRSVFRVVEFAEGSGGVNRQEWFLYVLDTLPIFLVVCSFNFFFPGSYLPFMGFRVPKHAARAQEWQHGEGSATALQTITATRNNAAWAEPSQST
ncbi:RTA1-domain-containing protein [Whalleya microplaca]|nr:RTA1-domain-containing protein [Whalleya microplaca]